MAPSKKKWRKRQLNTPCANSDTNYRGYFAVLQVFNEDSKKPWHGKIFKLKHASCFRYDSKPSWNLTMTGFQVRNLQNSSKFQKSDFQVNHVKLPGVYQLSNHKLFEFSSTKTHQETRWAPATATKLLASSAARKAWSWSRWFVWVWFFTPKFQWPPGISPRKWTKVTPPKKNLKENSLPNIKFYRWHLSFQGFIDRSQA